jgi:hypothetical protein
VHEAAPALECPDDRLETLGISFASDTAGYVASPEEALRDLFSTDLSSMFDRVPERISSEKSDNGFQRVKGSEGFETVAYWVDDKPKLHINISTLRDQFRAEGYKLCADFSVVLHDEARHGEARVDAGVPSR